VVKLCNCVICDEEVSIYHLISLSRYLSIYLTLSIDRSIYLSTDISIYLPIYLSIYLSIYISIYLSISLSIYLSIYQSIDLSIFFRQLTNGHFAIESLLRGRDVVRTQPRVACDECAIEYAARHRRSMKQSKVIFLKHKKWKTRFIDKEIDR